MTTVDEVLARATEIARKALEVAIVPPRCLCSTCRQVYAPDGLEIVGEYDNGVAVVPVVVCPLCGAKTQIIIAPRTSP